MKAAGAQRFRWMDILRGVAIILVVVWHSVAIPALFGHEMPSWVRSLNDIFLPFRMPTLMFLSGYLLNKSLQKPVSQYYMGKLKLLVWPYLIWAFIHLVTYDYPIEMSNPRAWIATGYLWFLFYITCFYFIAPIVRSVPPWIVLSVAGVVSFFTPDGAVKHFLYFAVFFFAGHWAGAEAESFQRMIRKGWVLPAGILAAAFGIVSAFLGESLAYRAEFAILSLGGIVAFLCLSQSVDRRTYATPVAFVGERSIVFYVSHFPIILGVYYLCREIGLDDTLVISVLGIVAAISGGWILAHSHRAVPIKWLFQAPTFPSLSRVRSGS